MEKIFSNQADYTKENNSGFSSIADKEADSLRKHSIRFESATVPYKGNGILAGLKGKKLVGADAATDYARRLNFLMTNS